MDKMGDETRLPADIDAQPVVRAAAALHAMHFAGLRVSEVCALSPRDLNKREMTLRVRLGKGKRDRNNLGVPGNATFDLIEGIEP